MELCFHGFASNFLFVCSAHKKQTKKLFFSQPNTQKSHKNRSRTRFVLRDSQTENHPEYKIRGPVTRPGPFTPASFCVWQTRAQPKRNSSAKGCGPSCPVTQSHQELTWTWKVTVSQSPVWRDREVVSAISGTWTVGLVSLASCSALLLRVSPVCRVTLLSRQTVFSERVWRYELHTKWTTRHNRSGSLEFGSLEFFANVGCTDCHRICFKLKFFSVV